MLRKRGVFGGIAVCGVALAPDWNALVLLPAAPAEGKRLEPVVPKADACCTPAGDLCAAASFAAKGLETEVAGGVWAAWRKGDVQVDCPRLGCPRPD